MGKPKFVREVGFVLLPNPDGEIRKPGRDSEIQPDEAIDAFGMIVKKAMYAIPLCELPADEREAILQAQEARVERELAELEADLAKHQPPPGECKRWKRWKGDLPDGRTWESLIVVNCRCCSKIMLSPKDEYLREMETTKRVYLRDLPPRVGAKVGEFYVCQTCHEDGIHACSVAKAV